jgi:ribosomal protein S18 acetylase RimI-like enzyme
MANNHPQKTIKMDQFQIREAQPEDFGPAAAWIVEISSNPAQQCLHSWAGEDAAALAGQLRAYHRDGELVYFLAFLDGDLVGVMGSEYDKELRRAWLHGPLIAFPAWENLAKVLYDRVMAALPSQINQWDVHLRVENEQACSFYGAMGFVENGYTCDYCLSAPGPAMAENSRCIPLLPEFHESFDRLYRQLFPAGYYSGERMARMIGAGFQVLVVVDAGDVQGFVAAGVEEEAADGIVHFLGVRADCRGRGLGRSLLAAGVQWLLEEAKVSRVCLNVRAEKLETRRLYERAGFKLRFQGVSLRKIGEGRT